MPYEIMQDGSFWLIAIMYSLVAYFHGHQGSHVVAVRLGGAELSPVLTNVLNGYGWLYPISWLFLIWYGYKTIWWYAASVFVFGFVFRLLWTKLEMASGLIRNAWLISLVGIPVIPLLLVSMVELTFMSTGTSYWLEACRRCPV
jgi:hypothetical protein